ncbi:hypothetical protein ACFX11_008843 [Malus domestica]
MLNFMFKSPSMFNNSKSSAHRSTTLHENRRFRPYVFQHDPWRWAPPSIYNDFINKTKPRMRSYDFYHFLGMAGDCNPKWGAGLGFGSGSKRKKRGFDDNDDAGADRDKKKGKYVGVIDDLKVSMSNVTLSLATGSGDVDKSDSGLDWEDGECMYVVGGDGEASTSKTEELDLNLKL